MGHNQLRSLSGLPYSISSVDACCNQIERLTPALQQCSAITELCLPNNQLSSLQGGPVVTVCTWNLNKVVRGQERLPIADHCISDSLCPTVCGLSPALLRFKWVHASACWLCKVLSVSQLSFKQGMYCDPTLHCTSSQILAEAACCNAFGLL